MDIGFNHNLKGDHNVEKILISQFQHMIFKKQIYANYQSMSLK